MINNLMLCLLSSHNTNSFLNNISNNHLITHSRHKNRNNKANKISNISTTIIFILNSAVRRLNAKIQLAQAIKINQILFNKKITFKICHVRIVHAIQMVISHKFLLKVGKINLI